MSTMTPVPKGSAATPAFKKKVAVFGAGGYLGATIFGFLQRASSLYGTGLGGPSTPRAICATGYGSVLLNKVLSQQFKLAYASEYMVTLTNMEDEKYIQRNLKNMDAAILGTNYVFETRPVTANTYEKGPNTKAKEIYLGGRKGLQTEEDGIVMDTELQIEIFRNSVQACAKAGLKHLIVLQTTPNGEENKIYAEILDQADIPFTYICMGEGGSLVNTPLYTFETGLIGNVQLESFTLAKNYKSTDKSYNEGDWMNSLLVEQSNVMSSVPTAQEDVAALAVQCLLSCDWEESRILQIGTSGKLTDMITPEGDSQVGTLKTPKSDKYWCNNSETLALKLASVK